MINDYIDKLQYDTQNAKEHVDKVFPNKNKQAKIQFSQRYFKLDKVLAKKLQAIRRGQGWDPQPHKGQGDELKRSTTKLAPSSPQKSVISKQTTFGGGASSPVKRSITVLSPAFKAFTPISPVYPQADSLKAEQKLP